MTEATLKRQIKKALKEIEPEDGWWKSYTPEGLQKVMLELVGRGLTVEEAAEAVDSIVSITRVNSRGEVGRIVV